MFSEVLFAIGVVVMVFLISRKQDPFSRLFNRLKKAQEKNNLKPNDNEGSKDGASEYPADWPGPGPIDLQHHDLPHESAGTEWWYLNGHLNIEGKSGPPPFSFFAVFFRRQFSEVSVPACVFSWAIIDTRDSANPKYYTDCTLDGVSFAVFKEIMKSDYHGLDKLLAKAIMDSLEKKIVPGPDHYVSNKASISMTPPLSLELGGSTFSRDDATGKYKLKCQNKKKQLLMELEFDPQREPTRQAHNGVVSVGIQQETMFYYSIQNLSVRGKLSVPSITEEGAVETFKVKGTGWYDHEFGGDAERNRRAVEGKATTLKDNYSWDWFSLQLSNDTEIAATHLVDPAKNVIVDSSAIITSKNGRMEYHDLQVKVLSGKWVSMRTTIAYPTKYSLIIPSAKIDLIVEAAFAEQEFLSYIARPAFWEGRMHVQGTVDGKKVTGYGFLEINTGLKAPDLQQFFKAISKEVFHQVENVFPRNPDFEQATAIVSVPSYPKLMKGLDIDVLSKTIMEPVRTIVDRGGKSWRSYALLLCIDSVGGESNKFRHWLAWPEIMHVGSLIIDDIQDESEMRRGGPSCHKIYGTALSINAANAAYFMCLNTLQNPEHPYVKDMTDKTKLFIYEEYFRGLRAGHVGQALDIYGLDHLLPLAVESGTAAQLLERIECCHMLKSAAPPGSLARVGAHLGGGTPEQGKCLGEYFEAVGLAFQIMDDVINLRGFERNSKNRGEDLTAGKITHPIAMAMKVVASEEERKSIADRLKSKPNPLLYSRQMKTIQETINNLPEESEEWKTAKKEYAASEAAFNQHSKVLYGLLDDLEACGAIDASSKRAKEVVDAAWAQLDQVIEDTQYKVMLQAFGQYVLKQHY